MEEKTYGQALQEGLNIINSGDESNEKCLSNSSQLNYSQLNSPNIMKIFSGILPVIQPDKFPIDGHDDIRIKKAGFNLTQNDDSRKIMKEICEIIINEKLKKETKTADFFQKGQKVQKVQKGQKGFTTKDLDQILDDIKIDIGDFVNSKKEYRDAKNNIEIAYECLSSIIFDLNSIIDDLNSIDDLNPIGDSNSIDDSNSIGDFNSMDNLNSIDDLNSIIASKEDKNRKEDEARQKIATWYGKINDIKNIKWNSKNSFSLNKLNELNGDIIAGLELIYIPSIKSNLSIASIESLRSLFVTLSKLVRDHMKQAVQVLSEIAQDNQKFYYKAAIGLKKLEEKIKLCKEYMDKAANKYLIDNINLEYKYLITKEKNEKEEKSKVYTKFFKKL